MTFKKDNTGANQTPKPVMAVVTYCDDKTVANVTLDNGSSRVGKARCVGDDVFDPCIGAFIAMCKALGSDPVMACKRALAALRRSVKASYVKVRPACEKDGTQCGLVRNGHVMLRPDKHLAFAIPGLKGLGKMGEETKLSDRNGKTLYVGDLVTVEKLTGTVRYGRKWEDTPGLHFVVCEDSAEEKAKGAYIMGLRDGCNGVSGKIDGRFRVRLAKTWKAVELGESHDHIVATWEADNNE